MKFKVVIQILRCCCFIGYVSIIYSLFFSITLLSLIVTLCFESTLAYASMKINNCSHLLAFQCI